MKKIWTFVLLAPIIIGCGTLSEKEIGRLSINEVSTSEENYIEREVSISLAKDDEIAFWSEIDIEYERDLELRFRVELLLDDVHYGDVDINPMDKKVTIGEIKTTLGSKTKWSFEGRNRAIRMEKGGKWTFKGFLISSESPSLIVNKAELIIKK